MAIKPQISPGETPSELHCARCRRDFVSERSMKLHLTRSRRHNVCHGCPGDPDFETGKILEAHWIDVHHLCRLCICTFPSASKLESHQVDAHNLCRVCEETFVSPNAVRMHAQTHLPRSLICYGCDRDFKSTSGMLIHLEAGNCASGCNLGRVEWIAGRCYGSDKYRSPDWPEDSTKQWQCPTCTMAFTKLSGLFQHVESNACAEVATGGSALQKFLRFLQRKIQPIHNDSESPRRYLAL